MNTTQDILTAFELYTGGSLSLSSTEELALAQKIYDKICDSHEWEFLKTSATGTLSTTVPYVTWPVTFDRLTSKKKFYILNSSGQILEEWYVVPFEDKLLYVNTRGYAYDDVANSRLTFTKQPDSALSYSYDHIKVPTDLDLVSSNPIFPSRFWYAIYHGMLVDNDIIEMSEKARAFSQENAAQYQYWLSRLTNWNSKRAGYDTTGI